MLRMAYTESAKTRATFRGARYAVVRPSPFGKGEENTLDSPVRYDRTSSSALH